VEMIRRRRAGREYRDTTAAERLERPQPKLERNDRHVFQPVDRLRIDIPQHGDEIRDQDTVRVEIRSRVLAGSDDEDAAVDLNGRDRGAAAVEDHDVWGALGRNARTFFHVGIRRRSGKAAAGASASDRRNTYGDRRLEMIRGRVPA